jgi:hypothetical protein
MSKLYTLILNPGFNQEFYDCTFRNGRTGPVGQRTKDRLEQAFGGLRWEEWVPPVAEAPAPKKGRSKVASKKVAIKFAGEPLIPAESPTFTTPKEDVKTDD